MWLPLQIKIHIFNAQKKCQQTQIYNWISYKFQGWIGCVYELGLRLGQTSTIKGFNLGTFVPIYI